MEPFNYGPVSSRVVRQEPSAAVTETEQSLNMSLHTQHASVETLEPDTATETSLQEQEPSSETSEPSLGTPEPSAGVSELILELSAEVEGR